MADKLERTESSQKHRKELDGYFAKCMPAAAQAVADQLTHANFGKVLFPEDATEEKKVEETEMEHQARVAGNKFNKQQHKEMLAKMWESFDKDSSGSLEKAETANLVKYVLRQPEFKETMIDAYTELLIYKMTAALGRKLHLGADRRRLLAAVEVATSTVKPIVKKEYAAHFQRLEEQKQDLADEMIQVMDKDKDGNISKDEFTKHFDEAIAAVAGDPAWHAEEEAIEAERKKLEAGLTPEDVREATEAALAERQAKNDENSLAKHLTDEIEGKIAAIISWDAEKSDDMMQMQRTDTGYKKYQQIHEGKSQVTQAAHESADGIGLVVFAAVAIAAAGYFVWTWRKNRSA